MDNNLQNIIPSDKNRLKIGLFVDAFFPMVDGVIMVVDNYARRLAKFCDVTVFTIKPRGKYGKCTNDFPYKVVRCNTLSVPFLDYDLGTPNLDSKFVKELKRTKLDIVHIHSPFTMGRVGVEYARKHKIPAVASLHSQFDQDFYRATRNKGLTKLLLKKIMNVFNACDEYYAVNSRIAEVFKGYGAKHLPAVQQNATDFTPIENEAEAIKMVNEKFGLEPDMPLFLFVGRINILKNIYFILESLEKLKTREFKMIFVGVGQDLDDFKIAVSDSSVADNVIFAGKITDRELLKAIYLRSKLFLFPSMYDTNSLVQIEAASQKTPTVFIRGSATSSTVTEDVNGFITDPTPTAFAAKIMQVLEDDEYYKKVQEGAFRDLYATWDERVVEMYEKYLRNIEKKRIYNALIRKNKRNNDSEEKQRKIRKEQKLKEAKKILKYQKKK